MIFYTEVSYKMEVLTVIHRHLRATSRTVLSRNVAAILIYLKMLGSSANLSNGKQTIVKILRKESCYLQIGKKNRLHMRRTLIYQAVQEE